VEIVRGLTFFGAAFALATSALCALLGVGTERCRAEGYFATVRYNPPKAFATLVGRWPRVLLKVAVVLAVCFVVATALDVAVN
jgi:hypothetical protein